MFKQKLSPVVVEYQFVNMSSEYADEIAYKWKYSGKYSFYNLSKDKEDMQAFLKPESWNNIFAVIDADSQALMGFSTYIFENKMMWLGVGMKPSYTGKGYGERFVRAAIQFGLEHYGYEENKILLSVAKFNKRAIALYEKVGFRPIESKELLVNGKLYPFLIMGIAI